MSDYHEDEYPAENGYPVEEEEHQPAEEPEHHDEYPEEGEPSDEEEDTGAPQIMVTSRRPEADPSGGPSVEEIEQARAHLEELRAAHHDRVRAMLGDSEDYSADNLPSVDQLRQERVRLSEEIRHHKDEQDSLALDIENQEGASDVYQLAARVQRFEHFAAHCSSYVEQSLASDVEKLIESDQRQSEEEIAAYIKELQGKREAALGRINQMQQRSGKMSAASKQRATAVEPFDENAKKSIQHTLDNEDENLELSEKTKKFRAMKTKLQADIVQQKHDAKKEEEQVKISIKNAELANARDARMCKELNNQNATITTSAQLLLNQLNVEHYGIDNAPTAKEIAAARKAREATPPPTPKDADGQSVGSRAQSQGSRQPSLAKPPLVALKPTEAQRAREEANRNEREEMSVSRTRHETSSYQSSRRQSLAKPPLVASKPTEAQRIREEANRNERDEQQSGSRQRSRGMSISSDQGRPPSVAGKSTASQRSREAK